MWCFDIEKNVHWNVSDVNRESTMVKIKYYCLIFMCFIQCLWRSFCFVVVFCFTVLFSILLSLEIWLNLQRYCAKVIFLLNYLKCLNKPELTKGLFSVFVLWLFVLVGYSFKSILQIKCCSEVTFIAAWRCQSYGCDDWVWTLYFLSFSKKKLY